MGPLGDETGLEECTRLPLPGSSCFPEIHSSDSVKGVFLVVVCPPSWHVTYRVSDWNQQLHASVHDAGGLVRHRAGEVE